MGTSSGAYELNHECASTHINDFASLSLGLNSESVWFFESMCGQIIKSGSVVCSCSCRWWFRQTKVDLRLSISTS